MLKQGRIVAMSVVVFAIILAYVFNLMQMQVTNGEDYRRKSTKATATTIDIPAARGEILDRYGRVLATSTMSYSIVIEKELFPSSKKIKDQNDELLTLTDILNEKSEKWNDTLPISAAKPYTFTAGSDKEVKKIIEYYNKNRTKKMPEALKNNADANKVMTALKALYVTTGYSEVQQRILCGIRYEMSLLKQNFNYTKSFTFASDVSLETVTKIQERSIDLKGIEVQEISERKYPDGTVAPHVIGLTGKITAENWSTYKKKGYSADDTVGTFGIEQYMEDYLRGKDGAKALEVNDSGNLIGSTIVKQPKPGDNIVLTIDKDLQVTMQNVLPQIIAQIKADSKGNPQLGANAKAASAVVLNVKTGEVLAMATYPSYDLNSYKTNLPALVKDTSSPLLNRCIQGAYTPGSTFKPLVAVSALQNGVITKDTTWNLPPEMTIGTGTTAWTGHDDEGMARTCDVKQALSVSSNIFFFKVGVMLGIIKLDATANIFGIGQKTGIELNESKGQMSTPQIKLKKTGYGWFQADSAQTSIGQFYTTITPMQLANYISTLVKGGTRYQVHVVKQINSSDNSEIIKNNSTPTVVSKEKIDAAVIQTVKDGMGEVAEGGTAASVFGAYGMKVGAKTGTAQITKTTGYNSVFICFAPFDDPEIAISVVVEYGHWGKQAAPAAKTAIESYFSLDTSGNPVSGIAQNVKTNTLLQ